MINLSKSIFEFMQAGNLKTVQDWNARRELAKSIYSLDEINRLDQSGLITDLNLTRY